MLTTCAFEITWHCDGNVEILSPGLREAVDSRNIVGHSQVLADEPGIAGLVQIAYIWPGTIGVYLMDRDSDLTASLDSGDGTLSQGILGVFPNVDIARKLRSSTLVDDIGFDLGITDDCGVHLAGTDRCAISCNRIAHWPMVRYDTLPLVLF